MKIILDAMGGDLAPEAPVLGAIETAKLYGTEITLVGQGEAIHIFRIIYFCVVCHCEGDFSPTWQSP